MEKSPSWQTPVFRYWRNSLYCMEPERSLPRFQQPTTCPCPEPDQTSPCPPSHILEIHLNIILLFICLCLPVGLFPSGPRTKTLYTHPLSPHTCYMPRPSHSSRLYCPQNIWWGVQFIKLLILYFPTPLLPCPSEVQISSSIPSSQTPSAYIPPQWEHPSFTHFQNNRQNYSTVYLNFYIFG